MPLVYTVSATIVGVLDSGHRFGLSDALMKREMSLEAPIDTGIQLPILVDLDHDY